jgi:hypothetical protein
MLSEILVSPALISKHRGQTIKYLNARVKYTVCIHERFTVVLYKWCLALIFISCTTKLVGKLSRLLIANMIDENVTHDTGRISSFLNVPLQKHLIAHTAKKVAKILRRRIEKKIEDVLGEDQFGFRIGKGHRDAIGMLRIIIERTLEIDEELCVCFIDWQKAFDRIN